MPTVAREKLSAIKMGGDAIAIMEMEHLAGRVER